MVDTGSEVQGRTIQVCPGIVGPGINGLEPDGPERMVLELTLWERTNRERAQYLAIQRSN